MPTSSSRVESYRSKVLMEISSTETVYSLLESPDMYLTLLVIASNASLERPGDFGRPSTHSSKRLFDGRLKNLAVRLYALPLTTS